MRVTTMNSSLQCRPRRTCANDLSYLPVMSPAYSSLHFTCINDRCASSRQMLVAQHVKSYEMVIFNYLSE